MIFTSVEKCGTLCLLITSMNWEKKFTTWVGSRTSVAVHTLFFIGMFLLPFFGVDTDKVLLVLTTVVSLEAIYLSIFIQMSVNQNTESLQDVEEDIEEIQEDVDEIQEDVGEIQEDVDEIQSDVDEIQEDVDEIEKETEDIVKVNNSIELEQIHSILRKLLDEVEQIKKDKK